MIIQFHLVRRLFTLHPSSLILHPPSFILLAAFILRIINITGESLWRDEVDSVRFAFAPYSDIFANFAKPGQNGPLYHLMLRGWLSLTGTSDFTLRYFSLLFGVLSVALLYVLARRLLGRQVALFAMLLITLAPTHIWYGSEGKMYALQLALLLMALAKCKAQHGKWRAADASIFVICTTLSYGVHLLSPLFFPIALLYTLSSQSSIPNPQPFAQNLKSKIQNPKFLWPFALVTLPYLPFLLWQIPLIRDGMHTGHIQYSAETVMLTLALNWSYGLLDVAPFNWPPALVWAAPLALGLMALVGAWRLWQTRRFGLLLVLFTWIILPAVMVQLISLRVPLFEPRYVLWSSPALYLFAAASWQMKSRLTLILQLTFLILNCLGLIAQFTQPLRPDMRGAAAWVRVHWQSGDALIFQMPYGRHTFAYYGLGEPRSASAYRNPDGQTGVVFESPFTNSGSSPEWVALQMAGTQALSQRLWFVELEAGLWDERGWVRDWLNATMSPVLSRQFHGVSVSLHTHERQFWRVYLPVARR